MIKRKITYDKDTHTYSVSLKGMSKKHLLVFKYILANVCPLCSSDVEVHHFGGVDVPFQHLETFIPLAEVSKVCMSTQNGVLRDIARCFTNDDLDIPLRDKLYSFVKFKKISKYE